jgi:hypothetical protein
MQTVPLSIDLLNQILGYLGTKPYQESFQLIDAIQNEVKAAMTPTPVDTPPTE